MSKVSARWVPRLLTPDQADHVTSKPAIFEADQASFLDRFLTQDKCWVHHFEPETKRQSMQWSTLAHPSKECKGRVLGSEGDGISFLGCKGHSLYRLSSERQNY